MTQTTQRCPVCTAELVPNPRYPRYVCQTCAAKASTGAEYASHECYIDGVECRADEARFGGIIIQTVQ